MPRSKYVISSEETRKPMRPAFTPDARENQMISLAIDLAEKQLADGTASSQVITHFLKLGSSRERLEQELLVKQRELQEAKTKNLVSSENSEVLYKKALRAMQIYTGAGGDQDDIEED